jgi:hypothetical protein
VTGDCRWQPHADRLVKSSMVDPPTSLPALLEYAKRPRLGRRKWVRGAIVVLIVIVSTVGWRWGRDWRDRIVLLYDQRACLATAPPQQVAFDSDPARVARLAGDPNYAVVLGCAFRKPPAFWDQFLAAVGNSLGPARSQRALLFLHECRAPDGSRFIVELERTAAADESAYFIQGYDVESNVYRPATATHPAVSITNAFAIDVIDSVSGHTDIRIYAGQPDTSDPSHFTIRYESGGKTGTVDGRVDSQGHLSLARPAGS